MARIPISLGGGGTDTSMVTAGAGDVLETKIIVGSEGELIAGAMKNLSMSSSGDTTLSSQDGRPVHKKDSDDGNIWFLKNPDGGLRLCTSMPKAGAVVIAEHTLVGIGATLLRQKIGYTDSSKVLAGTTIAGLQGTLSVQSVLNFNIAVHSYTTIRISWTNPTVGPWEGVFIQMSTGGYPGSNGGARLYTGPGNNPTPGGENWIDLINMRPYTTYFFTVTSYVNNIGWGASYNLSAVPNGHAMNLEGLFYQYTGAVATYSYTPSADYRSLEYSVTGISGSGTKYLQLTMGAGGATSLTIGFHVKRVTTGAAAFVVKFLSSNEQVLKEQSVGGWSSYEGDVTVTYNGGSQINRVIIIMDVSAANSQSGTISNMTFDGRPVFFI